MIDNDKRALKLSRMMMMLTGMMEANMMRNAMK